MAGISCSNKHTIGILYYALFSIPNFSIYRIQPAFSTTTLKLHPIPCSCSCFGISIQLCADLSFVRAVPKRSPTFYTPVAALTHMSPKSIFLTKRDKDRNSVGALLVGIHRLHVGQKPPGTIEECSRCSTYLLFGYSRVPVHRLARD